MLVHSTPIFFLLCSWARPSCVSRERDFHKENPSSSLWRLFWHFDFRETLIFKDVFSGPEFAETINTTSTRSRCKQNSCVGGHSRVSRLDFCFMNQIHMINISWWFTKLVQSFDQFQIGYRFGGVVNIHWCYFDIYFLPKYTITLLILINAILLYLIFFLTNYMGSHFTSFKLANEFWIA